MLANQFQSWTHSDTQHLKNDMKWVQQAWCYLAFTDSYAGIKKGVANSCLYKVSGSCCFVMLCNNF